MAKQQIEQVAIEALIPYARNSRTHSDAQVAQIAASIKEFGFTNPVLIDEDDGIIAGHGRTLAARKLGLEQVPCIRLTSLSSAQKKAYIIADNKLALNAGWDDEMLKVEIQELTELDFNLDLLGFNADELHKLVDDVSFDPATEDDQGKLDQLDPKWISCPKCGGEFDARQA
tara:strand:+ start:466 stop:981 length:516 start_codon:yes stop_codon:yes gene_type:complete